MSDIKKHNLKDPILFARNYTPPMQKIVHSSIDVLMYHPFRRFIRQPFDPVDVFELFLLLLWQKLVLPNIVQIQSVNYH
jgi:hypothetical protein